MRHTLMTAIGMDLCAALLGLFAVLVPIPWLLLPAGAILAAGLVYALVRFRCPFCRRFVGIGNYAPGRCCPFCGADLEEDQP